MRFSFLTMVLVLAGTGSAWADAQSDLAKFLNTPAEQQAVRENAIADWNLSSAPCPTAQGALVDVAFYKMPTFNAAGAPTSGVWKLTTRWTGCGKSKTFNLFYNIVSGGQSSRTALLPGATIADPLLQRDAIGYAKLAVEANGPKPAGCNSIRVVDTTFGASGAAAPTVRPGVDPRSWTESWTVDACGAMGIVKVSFLPDATGTTISASVDRPTKPPAR